MSDTTIDSLNLQISSSTQQAVNSINKLLSSLKGLNSSLKSISSSGIRNYSKEIGTVAASLKSLNNIKTTGIDEVTRKLATLSQLDLSKIDGQKIKIKVDIDTSDSQKNLKYAIQKTMDSVNINADKISKSFSDSLGIRGDSAKAIKNISRRIAEAMANSFDGEKSIDIGASEFESLFENIMSSARMSEATFNGAVDDMESEWKDFYNYFNTHKVYVSAGTKREYGKSEWSEEMSTANKRYVNGTKGVKTVDILDGGGWEELFGIGQQFGSITDQSGQLLGSLEGQANRLKGLFEAIAKAKSELEGIKFEDLGEGTKDSDRAAVIAVESIDHLIGNLRRSVKDSIQTNMQGVEGKLPVDVNVNQDKIIKDIRNAINKVAELKYNAVKVNLNVDTQSIKDSITQKLSEIDSGQLTSAADSMEKLSTSMQSMGNVNYKDNGLNAVVNSLGRLAQADMSAFDSSKFSGIMTSLSQLSTIPDVSNNLNRFVSAIAKLASAGNNVSLSANALPKLGASLRTVTADLGKVNDVSTSVNTLVASIAKLASAGNRTGQTAEQLAQLGEGFKNFMDSMKDAPDVSENVLRMAEALGNIANSGNRASGFFGSGGSGSGGSDNISKTTSLVRGLAGATTKLANSGKNGLSRIVSSFKQIGNSGSSLQTATYNLKNLFSTIVGYRGISSVLNSITGFFSSSLEGKGILEIGSDIAEIENVVDVSFGSMADKAYEFAESATEAYGLSELAAKEYSGTMMAMLKSSGLGGTEEMKAQAAEMSTTLAGLAGDMASFFNIDTDTAFYKIRAGISGEIEPLKQVGINMSVANLSAYALSQGITTSYNSMSQAEKTLLRYNYLMSVSSDMQGDFARTSGTYANQVRLLKLNIQSLASVIGQGLIAAVLPGIQALNALMTKLMQAATVFRDFMYVLMGKKIKGSQSGVVNDLAGLEDTSVDLSGIEDAGDSAADGLDNATSAAQDLKKALSVLPFDELNQLTDNSNSGNSGTDSGGSGSSTSGSGTGLSTGLSDLLDDAYDVDEISPVNEWAEKIRKAFLNHDWEGLGKTVADGLNKGMKKIYDLFKWEKAKKKIVPFIDAFTTTVNSLVDYFDWDLMGRTIGEGINTLTRSFNLLTTQLDFASIGKGLAEGLKGAIDQISWEELGNALGNGFMVSWRLLGGFITEMSQENDAGLTGWQLLGTAIANTFNGLFDKIDFSHIADVLTGGINGAFSALATFVKDFDWNDFADNVGNGIAKFLQDFKWEENGKALGDFLNHLCTALKSAITKDTFYELGKGIGTFLSQLPWGELLLTAAQMLISGFAGLFEGAWASEGLAGKIAACIGAAFAITKIGSIFGMDNLALNIVTTLGGKLIGLAPTLAGKLTSLIGTALTNSGVLEKIASLGTVAASAAKGGLTALVGKVTTLAGSGLGSLSSFASAILPLVGTAGLIVGVGSAAVWATSKLASWIEKLQGGNGTLSEAGTALENYIEQIGTAGKLTNEQVDEIWALIEADEAAGKSKSEMIQTVIGKLGEFGVSASSAKSILGQYNVTASTTVGTLSEIESNLDTLGDGFSTTSGTIDASSMTTKEAIKGIRDVLYDLSLTNSELSGTYQGVLSAFENSSGSCTTAQDALDLVTTSLKNAGVPLDEFNTAWGTEFPSSMVTASASAATETAKIKSSVDTNVVAAHNTYSTAMSAIGTSSDTASSKMSNVGTELSTIAGTANATMPQLQSSVTSATSAAASAASANLGNIASSAENNMSSAASSVGSYSSNIQTSATTAWGTSYQEVSKNIGWIKIAVSTKFSEIYGTVKSWSQSIYNAQVGTSGSWIRAKSEIEKTLGNLNTSVGTKLSAVNTTASTNMNKFSGYFKTAADKIGGYFGDLPSSVTSLSSNMYSAGQTLASKVKSGFSSVHIPTPHMYVSSYTHHYYGNGGVYSTPNYSVRWYKKGGLFNSESIIGVGEAGKEAVLPLENKRTMKMIADSIADSSGGGIGLSHDEMSNAVAEGVAMAMMNNASNTVPQYVMASFSIGENEIVKAVAKAQNKYNSRMNPSPAY